MYGYNQLLFVTSHRKFAYSGQPLYWIKMPWNQSGPIKRHPLYSFHPPLDQFLNEGLVRYTTVCKPSSHHFSPDLLNLSNSFGNTILVSSDRDVILHHGRWRDVDSGPSLIHDCLGYGAIWATDERMELLLNLQVFKRQLCLHIK